MRSFAYLALFLGQVGLFFLLPLILLQARHVKATTRQLPSAKGETKSQTAVNNMSLLHIGESTVAGVGVTHLKQGLTHAIVTHLSEKANVSFDWHIQGKNGVNIAQLNTLDVGNSTPDVLLITIGVNDTTGLTSLSQWRQQIRLCIQRYAGKNTYVFFTQVPNMARFPALPAPLSWFLGLRSQQLDNALLKLCHIHQWHHLKASAPIKAQWMAKDGYHPNEDGYQAWGNQISQAILDTLSIHNKDL